MSSKLPKHQDLDTTLWPGIDKSPVGLFAQLGCLATALLFIISWLILFSAMAAGWVEWNLWPYVIVPIALWLILLAGPAFFSARRGTLAILDAVTMTAEAWLARAGYSVDLNNDGYIGQVEVKPVQTDIIDSPVWNSPRGTKLLAQNTPTPALNKAPEDEETTALPYPVIERKLWKLPNNIRCPQETLEEFVDGIFLQGWGRGDWVPKTIDRDTYDGLIALIENVKILEDRKKGFKGRLAVRNARQARMVLNLPLKAG